MRRGAGKALDLVGLRKPLRHSWIAALDRLGVKHSLSTGDLVKDIRQFMRRSPSLLKSSTSRGAAERVLFFSARGAFSHMPYVTGVVAHGLRLRDVEPDIVLCDEILPACESVAVIHFEQWKDFQEDATLPTCRACFSPATRMFDAFQLPYIRMSQYVNHQMLDDANQRARFLPLDEVLSFEMGGVHLGEHVRTSLYRFLLTGALDADMRTTAIARKYLAAGIAVYHAARGIIEETKPICLVSHHGIYLIGGIGAEVAQTMGIRVVTWDATYRKNTVIASHNRSYHYTLLSESCDSWKNTPLTEAQVRQLNEYFSFRRQGAREKDYITYHPNPISDKERIIQLLHLDTKKKLIALFTNVTWDGRVHVPDGIFAGPLEWAIETVRYLSDRSDVQVVVRVHPAEVKSVWVTQQRMDDEIRRAFPNLPSNLVIVPPESDVNSYTLAELANVAVVYSSKIGLEALLMEVPVIIAGDAFYSNKGIGYNPKSREEYFALLDRVGDLPRIQPDEMERIRRYAYYFYFRRALPVPNVVPDSSQPYVRSLESFLPGREKGLDTLCDGILTGKEFVLD
jgi:hypothetical protein